MENNLILVLELQGKGNDRPDKIKLLKFETKEIADKFINENIDLDSKYWINYEYISIGQLFELVSVK